MSFDHGELNIPLHKRGNLDAEIDKRLAMIERTRRDFYRGLARKFDADRADAKALIARMGEAHVEEWAARLGCQKRSVRKRLRDHAQINPRIVALALRQGGAE